MSQKELCCPAFQSKCFPNLHQTVTAWPTLAWGPTFPTNAELLETQTTFSAKKENAWIWKGSKRYCTRERRQEWTISSQSISLCQQACRVFITRICRILWELLHLFFFFCLNCFLASPSLADWAALIRGWRLSHPGATRKQTSGTTFLTVTGEDVPVGGRESDAPWAAQPQCFQLGGLGLTAVTGRSEGLLEDSAEGHQGLGPRCLAAVPLAPGEKHHLERKERWLPYGRCQNPSHIAQTSL